LIEPDCSVVEEIEILLEGYLSEFHEIQIHLMSMLSQIQDASEATNTHLVKCLTFDKETLYLVNPNESVKYSETS